jgi:hypothetical protein
VREGNGITRGEKGRKGIEEKVGMIRSEGKAEMREIEEIGREGIGGVEIGVKKEGDIRNTGEGLRRRERRGEEVHLVSLREVVVWGVDDIIKFFYKVIIKMDTT